MYYVVRDSSGLSIIDDSSYDTRSFEYQGTYDECLKYISDNS